MLEAFRKGNREVLMGPNSLKMQAAQMCGRLHANIEDMKEQEWNLLGLGDQGSADRCERERGTYEELFGKAQYRRGNPDVEPTEARFRNPVPVVGRYEQTCRERERGGEELNGRTWTMVAKSELKEAF